MSLQVEQDCPQCGGPLEMAETDRLLRCSFCNVQSFLSNTGPLHFILPRRQPDPYTVYAPYLRFKGTIYRCLDSEIAHQQVDISITGVKLPFLPASLGLRPQAMKMRFAGPHFPGSFLKKSSGEAEILTRAAKNLRHGAAKVLHQVFLGQRLNIIYLPLSIKDETIIDGIAEQPLAAIPDGATPFNAAEIDGRIWQPSFLPALCPQCGWNLEGAPDSVVLLCANCSSGWQAGGGSYSEVRVRMTPATANNVLFLPFWTFQVKATGIRLHSFADFIRLTNRAMVVQPQWEEMQPCFVSPAFRIRAKDFLRLSTQMTLSQRSTVQSVESVPANNPYPVTLTPEDAGKSLKLILANSAVAPAAVFPRLPETQIAITNYFLHYLPFVKTSHELRQPDLAVTINQRSLYYGRNL